MTHHLQDRVRGCLSRLYEDFSTLESQGGATAVVDREVDFSTEADVRLSESVQEYFDAQPETYTVLSEESDPDTDATSEWTVIVDEIDGTANMMNGGDVPFGPIIAISPATDPRFEDVVAMGFLALPSGQLYEAYDGQGASLTEGWITSDDATEESTRPLETSSRTAIEMGDPPQILVDQYMLSGRPELAELCWTIGYPGDFRSWAFHMALVARGSYDLAITGDHCELHAEKRATAEELAGGYLLVEEAGGTITTWAGDSLGPELIGMVDTRTFDTIVASTEELAERFSRRLSEMR